MARKDKGSVPLSGSRAVIAERVKGKNLTNLSTQIGRNASYLQQHLRYATPKVLPEKERRSLAKVLGVGEDSFREAPVDTVPQTVFVAPKSVVDTFSKVNQVSSLDVKRSAIAEIDIRKGMDQLDILDKAGGVPSNLANVGADWALPLNFIGKELRTQSKHLITCIYEGRGLESKLTFGDRIIVDRSLTNASPTGLFLVFDSIGLCVKNLAIVPGSKPLEFDIFSEDPATLTTRVQASSLTILGRIVLRINRL